MESKQYQISRQGQTLAPLGLDEMAQKWAAKELLPTDHYWTQGMAEWKPLSALAGKLEERLEDQRRLKREELARAKEAEMAQAAKLRAQAAPAQAASQPEQPAKPAAAGPAGSKSWNCADCNAAFAVPTPIADGGKDIMAGALLFFLGLFLCLIAFGTMFSGDLEPAARFLMLLVMVGGAFFCFCFGFANIITGGAVRAMIRVLGQRQCPTCGSLKIRPKA